MMLRQVRCMSGLSHMRQVVGSQLAAIKEAGTWKTERVITSKQSSKIYVEGSQEKLLNFCANNYLGLSSDPTITEAAKKALEDRGNGLSSVRFICGTQDIHKELEKKISTFHEREDTILYISCFDANAGIFETLLTAEDAIVSDELNHASIIDGIRLSKAQRYRYKHRDMKDLERCLQEARDNKARMVLIATDGVFSMDGTVAPLSEICDLADKYQALTFVDECHATGFMGETGRGTEEYLGVKGRVDIINSTLGKALGGAAGGYTTGPKELISLLRQKSRPYLFSNTLPPPIVGSANKVFEMLLKGSDLSARVTRNTSLFRSRMTQAGFNVIGDGHPICPVMMPDERTAVAFADKMLRHRIISLKMAKQLEAKGSSVMPGWKFCSQCDKKVKDLNIEESDDVEDEPFIPGVPGPSRSQPKGVLNSSLNVLARVTCKTPWDSAASTRNKSESKAEKSCDKARKPCCRSI